MQNMHKLLLLFIFAVCCFAQQPITNNGRFLVFPPPANATSTELFWTVTDGNTASGTGIIVQGLNQLPPSTTNQQWVAHFVVGVGGSSGLYIFSSSLSTTTFFGLDSNNHAVVGVTPTVFNITAMPQFGSGLVSIQVSGTDLAVTSDNVAQRQITAQPLVLGNTLQLWRFFAV
ncbi:hypothetical protein AURDEDRAFT_111376 [Auricularia subglabra TFB-10046 SS5]|nr:hypothetical protein AURDEDRAFT_111376 [Auricularia subglabra TFB-10046 SS5]